MSEADNGKVTFTVKELLGDMSGKLDRIVEKLDAKADAHDVDALEVRVTALEGTAATEASLTAERQQRAKERKHDRRWTLGFATTTLLGVCGLVVALIFDLLK